jgi:UDP-N-acetyl-D-glucosamine dehydrogenase
LNYETKVPNIDQTLLKKYIRDQNYFPSGDYSLISECKIIVIAVPTPLDDDRNPDLDYLERAVTNIAHYGSDDTLIINESTSYPGTLRNFIKPLIEKIFNFEYASAPERIDPANLKWNLDNTPRLVSGLTQSSTDKAIDFYRSICTNVHKVSQPEVAEAAKLFENTFRQINIALVNEFAVIAKAIGFSAHEAIAAASTKPFGFMPFYPSIGVGGHCIPIDPSYLSYSARETGMSAKFIELANITNLNMARYVAQEINSEIKGGLDKKRIQIAGISYKPEVADMREAPALRLSQELKNLGAYVTWHDPVVKCYGEEKSTLMDSSVDVGLIVTPHQEIDFSPWKSGNVKVFDLSANSLNYGWAKFF